MHQHVQQTEHWDCGLACVAMILVSKNILTSIPQLVRLATSWGMAQSVWSADLVMVLYKGQGLTQESGLVLKTDISGSFYLGTASNASFSH